MRIAAPDSGGIVRAGKGVPDHSQARQAGRGGSHRRGVRAQGAGPGAGTLSFRIYRDPARPDYLPFVEHFADQAAYDAHTGSDAYKELIAGRFAGLITEFAEINHELLVSM
jgi:quinol monooxygenase YgiN